MHNDNVRIKKLLTDYSSGTIERSEFEELQAYLKKECNDSELDALLGEMFEELELDPNLIIDSDSTYDAIIQHSKFKGTNRINTRPLWWLAGAAAAIALVVFRLFLFPVDTVGPTQSTDAHLAKQSSRQMVAGERKTILQLADGTEIDLDGAENGLIATENNIKISLKGTALHYESHHPAESGSALMNTITTSKGRQFQVVLPDGTNIWLNALSSLRYPVQFNPSSRRVEVSGEAYFEVEKASDWPFVVKTATQEISVLGTHFNISAYDDDESFKTTLVEGKLRVTTSKNLISDPSHPMPKENSFLLLPGQQAVTYSGNSKMIKENVDTEEVISWRNNLFVFNNEEISEVMKKVMRWYDIEIVYRDGMEGMRIGGTIPRFERIEQLMNALEATGLLHYKMEGGQVVIMK